MIKTFIFLVMFANDQMAMYPFNSMEDCQVGLQTFAERAVKDSNIVTFGATCTPVTLFIGNKDLEKYVGDSNG